MMRKWSAFFTLFLTGLLALTSVSMAVARVQPTMGTPYILCATDGSKTVILDFQGKPVAPHQLCPDCTLGITVALMGAVAAHHSVVLGRSDAAVPQPSRTTALRPLAPPCARGPPA
jgi:hypothetical protein